MSSSNLSLELAATPDEAIASYAAMLRELGCDTEVSDDSGRLVGREPAAGLCCRASPARVEIELEPSGRGRTAVEVTISIPGFGPIASVRLREWTLAIARSLRDRDPAPVLAAK